MVALLVILGLVLCAVGAVIARAGRTWRLIGGALAVVGLAVVVYELVFCDC